ncbi:hypothetical protein PR048_016470 [Dryococelus australis]|uniref:Uncharacterized protein n=1 Tax=Dryococelus australis TaxID=614101 RepID=A0ABQ9HJV3_9NEOP|nr:hypothetical protein PR048_016470 [Dryococelus australis]
MATTGAQRGTETRTSRTSRTSEAENLSKGRCHARDEAATFQDVVRAEMRFPEIWAPLNSEVLRPMRMDEVNMERHRNEGAGKREITEKTRRLSALSGTIITSENPVTRPGIKPTSPWWKASKHIA